MILLARVYGKLGVNDLAAEAFENSLEQTFVMRDPYLLVQVNDAQAAYFQKRGDLDLAASLWEANSSIAEITFETQAATHVNLAAIYSDQWEWESAITHNYIALEIFDAIDNARYALMTRVNLCRMSAKIIRMRWYALTEEQQNTLCDIIESESAQVLHSFTATQIQRIAAHHALGCYYERRGSPSSAITAYKASIELGMKLKLESKDPELLNEVDDFLFDAEQRVALIKYQLQS